MLGSVLVGNRHNRDYLSQVCFKVWLMKTSQQGDLTVSGPINTLRARNPDPFGQQIQPLGAFIL